MKYNKMDITKVIKELGIPANLKGYRYIAYGVELMINDIDLIDFTMVIYSKIAKRFTATPLRVERAIRHAIEVGWNRANIDFAKKMFGYSVDANKGKPTNSEFLATVADYVLMTQELLAEEGGAE